MTREVEVSLAGWEATWNDDCLESVAEETEQGRRALIVDDDDETREYLGELLRLSGYDVEAARDARGAWTVVTEREPDVVLIDITESGAKLLRDMRAHGIPTPAVFMTDCEEPLLELEALVVVRKPFCASDLLEAVEIAVERLE
jgi:CheY-like chemotaxis protein